MADSERVYQAIRAKQRDSFTCQVCGYQGTVGKNDINAHHIHAVEDGGNHILENLVTVCDDCHSKIHQRGPNSDGLYPPNLATPGETIELFGVEVEAINYHADERGRVCLGTDYANEELRVAVVEVVDD